MNSTETSTIKFTLKIETALLLVLFIFLVALMYLSKGSYTGGDTYHHYQIARYALKHPHLLLDHWGKPFFTLLFSPFAQLDYDIAKLFNVFIGVVASYITFLTAKKLQHKFSFTVIFFVLFSPIYFIMLNSVMTEILFSFLLIFIAYLGISKKYYLAALIFSFLPFVRTEGFILIAAFGLFLLFKKQWIPILLLTIGFLVYSFIGSLFYYHDFFWVFTKNPYPFQSEIYGHGDFLFFFKSYRHIWGDPQTLLLLLGMIIFLIKLFVSKKDEKELAKAEFNFIFFPAFIFFTFHVIAWWKGIFASDGEIRILASVIPLTAVIANRGLNFVFSFLPDKKSIQNIFVVAICVVIIYVPFRLFEMPLQMSQQQRLVHGASMFVKTNYPDNKVYYVDPLVSVVTGRDPYEMKLIQQWFPNPQHPEEGLNEGDIVLWDAHFCPNEGNAPLKNFITNNQFVLLKYLKPEVPFKVLGGNDYEVFVFQKRKGSGNIFNNEVVYENGFEEKSNSKDSINYNASLKKTGNFSYQLDSAHAYSPGYDLTFDKIKNESPYKIDASVFVYFSDENQSSDLTFVVSFDRNDKPYSYNAVDLKNVNPKINSWNEVKLTANVPNGIKDNDKIKIYIWYRGKKPVYVDDLQVNIKKLNFL